MGWNRRIVAPLLLAALGALGCREGVQGGSEQSPFPKPAKPDASLAELYYDAQGNLKVSKERVEWLEIPAGFERQRNSYGRHVLFEGHDIPLDKVRDFFGRRVLTGQVDEGPGTVFYRAVMPIDSHPEAVRLDIRLAAHLQGQRVSIDVEPLTYGDVKPLSDQAARELLRREQAIAE